MRKKKTGRWVYTLRMPWELYEALEQSSACEVRSKNAQIVRYLKDALEREGYLPGPPNRSAWNERVKVSRDGPHKRRVRSTETA